MLDKLCLPLTKGEKGLGLISTSVVSLSSYRVQKLFFFYKLFSFLFTAIRYDINTALKVSDQDIG